jgi:hypothetical protein
VCALARDSSPSFSAETVRAISPALLCELPKLSGWEVPGHEVKFTRKPRYCSASLMITALLRSRAVNAVLLEVVPVPIRSDLPKLGVQQSLVVCYPSVGSTGGMRQ